MKEMADIHALPYTHHICYSSFWGIAENEGLLVESAHEGVDEE